jgi:hypothetical protein
MNWLDSNIIIGLPALIGVIGGLKLYVEGTRFAPYVLGALALAFGAVVAGHFAMRWVPRIAFFLIELWIVSAVAVTALATAIVMWVTLDVSLAWIVDLSEINVDSVKTLKGAFVAAISTYVALVWTKDIGDAKGFFWPSTQFKNAIDKAFRRLQPQPPGTSEAYAAAYLDVVGGHGNLGWSLPACWIRATIFSRNLPSR